MYKPESNKGISGRIKAFSYSFDGLKAAWKNEPSFKGEVLAAPLFLIASCFITQDTTQRALLIATVFSVLALELINSAIEAAIDRHGDEIHPLSKIAKDTGSAALLMTFINFIIIWSIIICDNWQNIYHQ